LNFGVIGNLPGGILYALGDDAPGKRASL